MIKKLLNSGSGSGEGSGHNYYGYLLELNENDNSMEFNSVSLPLPVNAEGEGENVEGIDETSTIESATTAGQSNSEDTSTTQVGCFIHIFGSTLQCYILVLAILCPVVAIAGVVLALKFFK